ncbi:TPA: hypothetical protein ACHVFX_001625, partial [Streptococcus suis]
QKRQFCKMSVDMAFFNKLTDIDDGLLLPTFVSTTKKPPAFAEGFLKYNDSGWAAYPTSQVLSRVRQEPF